MNPQLEESVETESVVESLQLNESVEAKTQVISMYHEKQTNLSLWLRAQWRSRMPDEEENDSRIAEDPRKMEEQLNAQEQRDAFMETKKLAERFASEDDRLMKNVSSVSLVQ